MLFQWGKKLPNATNSTMSDPKPIRPRREGGKKGGGAKGRGKNDHKIVFFFFFFFLSPVDINFQDRAFALSMKIPHKKCYIFAKGAVFVALTVCEL